MVNIYLFIELLHTANAVATVDTLKALELDNCQFANVVVLSEEKLVAQLDCADSTDGDKAISQAEFQTAALARFDAADANKDGQVTAEERAAQREAWKANICATATAGHSRSTSSAPAKPGSTSVSAPVARGPAVTSTTSSLRPS